MQLIVEGVVPDLLHVIAVGDVDDAVLHGVLQGQDVTLALGLVAHLELLQVHVQHHTLVAGAPNKHSSGGVGARKVTFAHTGVIINNEPMNFFFHCDQQSRDSTMAGGHEVQACGSE